MAKSKSTGRGRARTVGKTTGAAAKVKPAAATTLEGHGAITARVAPSAAATPHTVVASPPLKTRGASTTARPPLGVMPGMRALSKTSTKLGVAPVAVAAHATHASPSQPAPMIAPPRDELGAPRDVGRLLRYGERFGDHRIDIRMLPLQLPVMSGGLGVVDPSAPKSWRVFDRPVGNGQFRVMLSVAKLGDATNTERLAAIAIHVGRPPIAKWTVAHYRGQKKPKSADALPRVTIADGWLALADGGDPLGALALPIDHVGLAPIDIPLADGRHALAFPCSDGDHAAYWAVDAADKPVCLMIELDIFKAKDWKVAKP